MTPERLPEAPSRAFDDRYLARTGRYAGKLDEVRWGYYRGWLHGQVRRAFVRKRWFQVVIRARDTALLVRIQDDGTIGFGRCVLLDLKSGGLRCERVGSGAPLRTLVAGFMAGDGTDAFLRAGGADLSLTRSVGASAWRLRCDWDGLTLDVTLDSRPAPVSLLTIGSHAAPYGHRPGLTQRAALLGVSGSGSLDGEPLDLADATAEVTYANAFLPPKTEAWLASAAGALPDGRRIAFALSDGDLHGTCPEAALLLDDGAFALPAARVDRSGEGAWRWADDSGALDLRFTPRADHRAVIPKGLGRSAQSQRWIFGEFAGCLPMPDGRAAQVAGLPGLCEAHRWG